MSDTALTMPGWGLGAGPLKLAGDDRLAGLAAAGDERAFAAIFERHHQALYRYCHSITGNPEDAADALQSTMLRAMRALPGEKRTIALKPWLFRVAHNESISLLRRRRPQADVEDEALGLQVTGPEASADLRARVQSLFDDLAELPDRQRSALVMRELSGLSYDEIAAALQTSTGAATQAVFGARKALLEFAEGRDTVCDEIQRQISRRDGRILASRKIRAHLRDCEPCTGFKAMIAARERDFAVLAPPLPAMAAAAMLQGLQGGGGLGGGGGLTAAGAAGGSGQAMATAVAVKVAPVLAAVAAGAGAGAIASPGVSNLSEPSRSAPSAQTARGPTAVASAAKGRERSLVLRAGAVGRTAKVTRAVVGAAHPLPAIASERAEQQPTGTSPADEPADRAPEKDRAPAERRPSEPVKDSPGSPPPAPAHQPPAPQGSGSSSPPAVTPPPASDPTPPAADPTPPSTPPSTTPPPTGGGDAPDDTCHRKGKPGRADGHCD